MKCLRCGSKTQVIETRTKSNFVIQRKRKCLSCNYRFNTLEQIAPLKIFVKKRNGQIEFFSQQKLAQGLKKAFTKRPIKKDEFADLVEKIKDQIRQKKKRTIDSKGIGQIVMENLKDIDQVAYLRFASVYRGFGSLKSFEKEIKKLKKEYGEKRNPRNY